ncbi:MAG: hypothetical protein N2323_02105 [candidate division WOR-3 bacterium]|nr:hypothetical protein [candidate division WOR-3 bacterium]MCX7836741.1 hypothetical protein [candidate division WOR-3 bacterium]MDW8113934.1 hypothetical protein [candidate division WOR-3 bacterium]
MPLIIFSQSSNAENIYYYLYESTDENGNPFAIIVEIWSDKPTSPGDEFKQVTVEELHNKGYRTPSESEADAQVKDEHEHTDGGYSSWIYCGYRNWDKYVECGSRTSRSWWPGFLGLEATTMRQRLDRPGPRERVSYHFWETWGYHTKWIYTCIYPSDYMYRWEQYGAHWFNSRRNPIYRSYAEAIW